jgi:hypothetical protein
LVHSLQKFVFFFYFADTDAFQTKEPKAHGGFWENRYHATGLLIETYGYKLVRVNGISNLRSAAQHRSLEGQPK